MIYDLIYGKILVSEYCCPFIYAPSIHLNNKDKIICIGVFFIRWILFVLAVLFLLLISIIVHEIIFSILIGYCIVSIYLLNGEKFSLKQIMINKESDKNSWYCEYWINEYKRSNGFKYFGETHAN